MHCVYVTSMKLEANQPIDDFERTLLRYCTTQASDAAHRLRSQQIRVRNQGHEVGH